jgi:hypothetical protein
LIIEVYSSSGELKQSIDTFPQNTIYQNVLYPAGAQLAAIAQGWGLKRQTPKFRRFLNIGAMLLEPADPVIWISHYNRRPLRFEYEPVYKDGATNALVVGTLGDQTVPIDTGIALGRALGVVGLHSPDPRFGAKSQHQELVDKFVYEGIWWLNRFRDFPEALYDPDNLDRGRFVSRRNRPKPPTAQPMRLMAPSNYWQGTNALRLPYLDERGEHTFNAPNPTLPFDIHSFMLNQTGWYLATGSQEVRDDECMEADLNMSSCEFFDPATFKPRF